MKKNEVIINTYDVFVQKFKNEILEKCKIDCDIEKYFNKKRYNRFVRDNNNSLKSWECTEIIKCLHDMLDDCFFDKITIDCDSLRDIIFDSLVSPIQSK